MQTPVHPRTKYLTTPNKYVIFFWNLLFFSKISLWAIVPLKTMNIIFRKLTRIAKFYILPWTAIFSIENNRKLIHFNTKYTMVYSNQKAIKDPSDYTLYFSLFACFCSCTFFTHQIHLVVFKVHALFDKGEINCVLGVSNIAIMTC